MTRNMKWKYQYCCRRIYCQKWHIKIAHSHHNHLILSQHNFKLQLAHSHSLNPLILTVLKTVIRTYKAKSLLHAKSKGQRNPWGHAKNTLKVIETIKAMKILEDTEKCGHFDSWGLGDPGGHRDSCSHNDPLGQVNLWSNQHPWD